MDSLFSTRFGFPLELRRKEMLAAANPKPEVTYPIKVMGKTVHLPIIRVPIELPKYRLSNGRTASLQQQWLANNPDRAPSFFESDPELLVAQEEQHKLLLELVKAGGLSDYFKDPKQEQELPILLDENGFVVNGNRRLCCWREMYHTNKTEYSHFSHIDVVVLPHCDEKEIDRIEADLQIKKDIRADYTWESRAIMMRQKQLQHGLTDAELAAMYDMSKGDVEQARAMLELASEYLKSRNLENQWSQVTGDENAFIQLHKALKKLSSIGDRELLKRASFALIDDANKSGGRLYAAIPKIQEHLPKVKAKLAQTFPVQAPPPDPATIELFGGSIPGSTPDLALPLAAEITKPENWDSVREIVVAVIAAEDELQKEKNNANYLLKLLADTNSKLQAAVADALRPESTTAGAEEQLQQIEQKVETIRTWLAKKHA